MSNSKKLVIILLDGFRWDYYSRDKGNLPGFKKLIEGGVTSEYLEPIFPVLSYPNWTTIGTGVYADKHGMIGNYMYDGSQDKDAQLFELMKKESTGRGHWWKDSVEPIWTTATKQGKRTYTRNWNMSGDVPFEGIFPEEATSYTLSPGIEPVRETLELGVQKLLAGFELVMLYTEHTDNVGHAHGPESPEMMEAVRDVDKILNTFLTQLDMANLQDVNLVIISDHGMTYTGEKSGTKYINIDDYIDEADVEISLDSGTYISIATVAGKLDHVYNKLKLMEGMDVYKKDEISDEYHFKKSKYVLDILVVAREGFLIRGFLLAKEKQVPYRAFNKDKPFVDGVHGYTPNMADQRGFFCARGPAFKKGHVHPAIKMVDLYQIFSHVIGIQPLDNDGDWQRIGGLFETGQLCEKS